MAPPIALETPYYDQMDLSNGSEPPSKKRRFFSDSDDEAATQSRRPSPPSPEIQHRQDTLDTPPTLSNHSAALGEPLNTITAQETSRPEASLEDISGFDQATFEAVVGVEVKPDILAIIRQQCGSDLERAVNMYFDGTWKNYKLKPKQKPTTITSSIRLNGGDGAKIDQVTSRPAIRPGAPGSRYVGAFGVEGWATRSGTNLLKHGDVVRIERQKIQPPKPPTKGKGATNKLGAAVGGLRVSAAAARRVDVIVRFTDRQGTEIGRLAKDTANWVSTLIDQKVCKFEGTCVYAPERLRTNDTVFIQLRCSLLNEAFDTRRFQLSDNRNTGMFEEQETAEERNLRLRQVALVRLFQEINLMPIRVNEATAKNSRQGLLQAAEMDDQKEAQPQSTSVENSDSPQSEAEDGKELEQDQLDALYKKAQSFDFDTPEAEPAETFAMDLRPYQKQSLYWMLAKEKDEAGKDRESSIHPLWEEYQWPTKDFDDQDVPQVADQPSFYVNPYSGEMSLEFPAQEQHCLGGILADEMGLGKTIQMLSLIHTHKPHAAAAADATALTVNDLQRMPGGGNKVQPAPYTTLVVAPMSLLSQWQSEAENASKEGTLKSIVYYGNDKHANLQALCSNPATAPDVIITSYGIVLSEFGQIAGSKSAKRDGHTGLFSVNFLRVILDEAHNIKNRQAKTSKACYELSADHRWVLTGTPIVNRLEDLFSLVRFLRVEPWNNFSFWRTFITVPFESKDFMRALDVVQTVLEPLVMRRTKDMKTPSGQPLVALPPKTIEIVDVEFSKTERAVYDHIINRARSAFQKNVEAGTVMKAYTSIFAQILRLRQSCCHPVLVRNQDIVADEDEAAAAADAVAGLADDMDLHSLIERFNASTDDPADANAFGAHVLSQIRDEAANECPICTEEPMIEQTVTDCWHSTCKKCILDYIKHQTDRHEVPRCVSCRQPINERDLFEVVRHDNDVYDDDEDKPGSVFKQKQPDQPRRISLQRVGVNDSSTKVVALIQHLRDLRRERPRAKVVVFSQFTSFLTLIEGSLDRANMHHVRLDGTMAQKTRVAVLEEFKACSKFTVFLISLRAGGVGLNLTEASRVYMCDPWWSFSVESQAIDRVHRMGQSEEVKVYRFIVKNSVEERMLKIQDRKKFIATSLGMMSDDEKRLARIEDIKELLS
ncbi:DNA repair protein rad5 [Pyricularia oryzae]|nr:DNA repair protein rad5 [Pyricularia oryzae]KAI6252333.1 DNA repair protein rad5 [Pyricularia oryzae]KAI6288395.1 DNA repair protein rad5 [Pyricularia oryzae]KAI6392935.1 DNA repair protein rad5 [Pyricularia oryzae]KAI6450713.1 DNA repair protein rad5 [Pyricularia oryzae]